MSAIKPPAKSAKPSTPATAPAQATAPVAETEAPPAKTILDVKDTGPAVTWDDLPDPEVAPYDRASFSVVDREATTPEPVKRAVNAAYKATSEAKDKKPVRMTIQCGTTERAELFVKLARLYAGFLGYTFRGGVNAKGKPGEVGFVVKSKEVRTRKDKDPELVKALATASEKDKVDAGF